ncbi:MAG: elongation factor G [Myxococcales bacterium]|nr:elongation factor G [Myxococcales bacterium]
MKVIESGKIRNVGLFGHGGSGKTSLAEAMLFDGKATTRLGKVEDGNTIMDWEPEEIAKTASISTGLASVDWDKVRLNILDTPGGANFTSESRNMLAISDLAVITVCAASGVQVQTTKFWELATELGVSKLIFINRMDRERANFKETVKDIQDSFKVTLTPLQIPIGQEESFQGVVDLLNNKAFVWERDGSGAMKEAEIPADLKAEVEEYRTKAIEAIAENDETLMMAYLEGETLAPEAIANALRAGLKNGSLVPLLCGSATKNIGVQPLMDLIADAGPSPLDRVKPWVGHNPDKKDEIIERKGHEDEPFAAIVLKSIIDRHAGKLSIFRVISGATASDSTANNSSRKGKERWGQVFKVMGKDRDTIDQAVCGDIVAVAKLKDTATGDTLCDEKVGVVLDLLHFPEPSINFAIQPKNKGDEDKIQNGFARLCEEDPTVRIRRDEQTQEFILAGVGQGQLEITVEKLKRKYGVEVTMATPKVPYKETIKIEARARYRHKKQTGGRGQFGECELVVKPLPRGSGYQFVDKIVGGVIPRQFIPAVDKGIQERLPRGVLAGNPIVDVEVAVVDGKFHPVDSSEQAFKMAGRMCMKAAIAAAKPILLEPIMNLEVIAPETNTGDIMGDLSSRRGRPSGMSSKGKNTIIKAQVPLAEVLRYEPDLRSMTSGQGSFTIEFSHYEEVPGDIAQKVIDSAQKETEEEE